jgi:3-phenylpropionate/trans-cinnamate dioxygenase ferredoxin subunit
VNVLVEIDAGDIPEGKTREVQIGRRELLLMRWRGELFAVRNVCPHMSMPMTGGRIRHRVTSTRVGDTTSAPDEPTIECPVHNYAYQLRTGSCFADSSLRVRTYKVTREGDRVFVELPARGMRATA